MCFAFGAKCGAMAPPPASSAQACGSRPSSEASAAKPRTLAPRPKNWRRVSERAAFFQGIHGVYLQRTSSRFMSWLQVMVHAASSAGANSASGFALAHAEQGLRFLRMRGVVLEQAGAARLHDARARPDATSARAAAARQIERLRRIAGAGLQRVLGEHARRLDELRVVQHHQRLERGIGALAAEAGGLARRRIEHLHGRRRRGALPEGVEAAAIERLAAVALVIASVAAGHRDRLPHALRLIRLHARAADFRRKQAARGEGGVAQHLGIHAEARTAREEAVLRIALELLAG